MLALRPMKHNNSCAAKTRSELRAYNAALRTAPTLAIDLKCARSFQTCLRRRCEFTARQLFVVAVRLGGHRLEVPDDAGPRETFQYIVGDIDFPPIETLAGAAHVFVVVIVPTFT